jgi:hypothetical protein
MTHENDTSPHITVYIVGIEHTLQEYDLACHCNTTQLVRVDILSMDALTASGHTHWIVCTQVHQLYDHGRVYTHSKCFLYGREAIHTVAFRIRGETVLSRHLTVIRGTLRATIALRTESRAAAGRTGYVVCTSRTVSHVCALSVEVHVVETLDFTHGPTRIVNNEWLPTNGFIQNIEQFLS